MGLLIFILCLDAFIIFLVVVMLRRRIKRQKKNAEHVEQLHKANDYIEWLQSHWEDSDK